MASRRLFGPQEVLEASSFKSLDFTGVSMRVFFLRANQVQLERFCDDYLNIAPESLVHFRPAAPFVMFQVLNYGRMSPVASNLGWVAQHEVLFGIPLQGYWPENGRRVEGMASVSPFIFVDNEWSVVTGREVYGWPKYPARLIPEVNPWMQDPRQERRLLSLETYMFPRLYAGQPLQRLVLLELVQRAPQFGQLPPDVAYLLSPFLQLPKAFVDTCALLPDVLRNFNRASFTGGQEPVLGMAQQLLESLPNMPPEVLFNTINLKQFRSSDPGGVAYQSLVNGKMQVKRLNASGMLGNIEQLRGDPTGGFTLLLHRYPDFPIIESLGLEVEHQAKSQGVEVAALKPLLPFWVSLDLRYQRGERLCWRGRRTQWAPGSDPPSPEPADAPARFNTVLGPIVEAIEGPFDFYDTTLRILPLKASRRTETEKIEELRKEEGLRPLKKQMPSLEAMLQDRLEEPLKRAIQLLFKMANEQVADIRVEVKLLPLVFVVIKKLARMSSQANDLGWWGGRSVDLVTVLRLGLRDSRESDAWTIKTHFLLTPYSFADTPLAVSAGREVLGLPTSFATISRGRDPWIDSQEPEIARCLLNVKVRDYPAIGVGQGSEERRLLEVHRVPGARVATAEDDRAGGPEPSLIDKVRDRHLERYGGGLRISNLSLKQFQDEEDPSLVCYRSLVAHERIVGKWAGVNEGAEFRVEALPGQYQMRFHELPSWPLVDALGLDVSHWDVSKKGSPVAVCDVHQPLWLKLDLRWNLPVALTRQSVDGQWQVGEKGVEYLCWRLYQQVFALLLKHVSEDFAGEGEETKQEEVKAMLEKILGRDAVEKAIRLPIRDLVAARGEDQQEILSLDDLIRDLEELIDPEGSETQSAG